MSYIWNLTKSISTQITKNSDLFTLSSKDDGHFKTISTEEKERITKSKTVSFGEVKVIDVESYKKYNEFDGLIIEDKEIGCMKRCGIYCKNCNIF